MNKILRFLVKKLRLLAYFFPFPLPVGHASFNRFYDLISEVYGLPNNDSFKATYASMVLNLDSTTSWKAPFFFCLAIKKAMANQVAYGELQLIKEREKASANHGKKDADAGLESPSITVV